MNDASMSWHGNVRVETGRPKKKRCRLLNFRAFAGLKSIRLVMYTLLTWEVSAACHQLKHRQDSIANERGYVFQFPQDAEETLELDLASPSNCSYACHTSLGNEATNS